MNTAVRIADCTTCSGTGLVRAQYLRPSGSRAKARPFLCPICDGRGGHVVRPREVAA